MYSASQVSLSLTLPSHILCCVAPFWFFLRPLGVHTQTGEGTSTSLVVVHTASTLLAKPRVSVSGVAATDLTLSVPPLGAWGGV